MLLRTIVGILAIALVTKLGPAWAGWLTVLLVAFWIWRAIPVPVKNDYMTPETFEQIYLRALEATEKSEEVNLLLRAGLGEPYHLSPRFLRKAASAANQLHRWLERNPTASPDQRLAHARKVVDRTGGPRSVSSGHR